VIPHFKNVNKFVVLVCTCEITPVLSRPLYSFQASAVFRARRISQICDQQRTYSVRAQYYLECVFEFIGFLLEEK
jgi:c-di-GMP-related signal transduction protein